MIIRALLLWTLLFAPVTAFWASDRGYDAMNWYCYGLALGPVGLLVGLLPKRAHAPECLFSPEWQTNLSA
jgi:hypothetical protein